MQRCVDNRISQLALFFATVFYCFVEFQDEISWEWWDSWNRKGYHKGWWDINYVNPWRVSLPPSWQWVGELWTFAKRELSATLKENTAYRYDTAYPALQTFRTRFRWHRCSGATCWLVHFSASFLRGPKHRAVNTSSGQCTTSWRSWCLQQAAAEQESLEHFIQRYTNDLGEPKIMIFNFPERHLVLILCILVHFVPGWIQARENHYCIRNGFSPAVAPMHSLACHQISSLLSTLQSTVLMVVAGTTNQFPKILSHHFHTGGIHMDSCSSSIKTLPRSPVAICTPTLWWVQRLWPLAYLPADSKLAFKGSVSFGVPQRR